ncbi:MAG: hypothetical protein JWM47_4146 [Acidimicrobiales bacterium]|nr:hypothetical protein [Acidimicrobiales bacterium]
MTHTLNHFLATLSLAFAVMVGGCATAPEIPKAAEQDYEVSETESAPAWLSELPATLSSDLCAEHELFRSCFPVSEDECHQRTQAIAASCEIQYRAAFPTIESDSQAAQLGGSIGECTGNKLYENLDATYPLNESESCKRILDET